MLLVSAGLSKQVQAQNKQLTFEDVIKFEDISNPVISGNGTWISYIVWPNKLDYAIEMKQYFDHYLKGEPAENWITDGVPYRGE